MQPHHRHGYKQAIGHLRIHQTHRIEQLIEPNPIRRSITSFSGSSSNDRPHRIICGRMKAEHLSREHVRASSVDSVNKRTSDAVNPPASTRPPEYKPPIRGQETFFAYLWNHAKAFTAFYKAGLKAIFASRRLAGEVDVRIMQATKWDKSRKDPDGILFLGEAIRQGSITRAEYQLLRRSHYDMIRLPLFGVLVVVLGEWLVFVLPFAPYTQPLTCRLPGLVAEMRTRIEKRRKHVFRMGIKAPEIEEHPSQSLEKHHKGTNLQYAVANPEIANWVVRDLQPDQLQHISATLNLHSCAWEHFKVQPPSWMIRTRIAHTLRYLARDDLLLHKAGGTRNLLPDELLIACEERGLDVLGVPTETLSRQLTLWSEKQRRNQGSPRVLMEMLFRRPNAWTK